MVEQLKVTVKNAKGNEVKANENKLTVTDKTEPVVPPTPGEKEVLFSKVNVGGEEIAGAKIQIKDAFSDVPNLPVSERPLICVTPRWMPEENFSDSASVGQIQ